MAAPSSVRREKYATIVEEDVAVEVRVDPDTPFGYVVFQTLLVDDNGDPLDLLIRAEEGDEVAELLMRRLREHPEDSVVLLPADETNTA